MPPGRLNFILFNNILDAWTRGEVFDFAVYPQVLKFPLDFMSLLARPGAGLLAPGVT